MKVLAKGDDWNIKATCTGGGNGDGGCGAVLLVEAEDVGRTESHDRDGSITQFATFRCPECQVLTDLPYNKIPSSVLSKARKLR